ncbi:MAG TPA: hypothetical protein PKD83_04155 [Ignavibacteria bacterium]|nr:hypothetical protein [Ignavibacteria bacterium]
MKNFIKNLIFTLVFILAVNFTFANNCNANTNSNVAKNSEKLDLVIVKTTEGGVSYINIYTDSGILVLKVAEL